LIDFFLFPMEYPLAFTNPQDSVMNTWMFLSSPRSPLCSRASWIGCWCETRLRGPRPTSFSNTPAWRRRVRRPASSLWWGRTGWDETCDNEPSSSRRGQRVRRFRWNRILLHTDRGGPQRSQQGGGLRFRGGALWTSCKVQTGCVQEYSLFLMWITELWEVSSLNMRQ